MPPQPALNSDEALWARTRLGDQGASRALFERHQPALLRFLGRRHPTLPEDEIEDIAQEVWCKVQQGDFDPTRGKFSTWLFGTANGLALNERRKKHRSSAPLPDDDRFDLANEKETPEHIFEGRLLIDVATEAFDALPQEQRQAVILRAQGLSCKEIAEATGVPVGTVKSRQNRATAVLKEKLESAGYGFSQDSRASSNDNKNKPNENAHENA